MDINSYVNFCDFEGLDYLTERFSKHLKELREYTQNSILTMGSTIKMPFQSIARYEKGKTEPSISNAYKIASYFFMSLEDFIFQNDVIALFEINIKKLCVFAPTQNIPICKERFPHLNIEKLVNPF